MGIFSSLVVILAWFVNFFTSGTCSRLCWLSQSALERKIK